jgi:Ca2+-binding EF-hand superfamily protein
MTVDPFELIYGVSVLCEGTEKDKAELVFKAIDLDGNGLISKPELLNYLGTILVSTPVSCVRACVHDGALQGG